MINIKVTTTSPLIPLIRQTPGSKGIWGNCRFHINDDTKEFDWWFVQHDLYAPQRAQGPKNKTVLITNEAAEMKEYRQDFIDQFGYVITCQRNLKHPRKTYRQQGLPWMIGHMGSQSGIDPKNYSEFFTPYDTLKTMNPPEKTKLISVITSYKNRTPGQEKRHALIKNLKNHFGDRLDVFGAGINYVRDKWDAIAPYKYHLAIENNSVPDYWTEKLSDAYLGFALPFYYGCPNIGDYFDNEALVKIDVNNHKSSIESIERALAKNLYEKHFTKIQKARELVLDTYNVFALMSDFCREHASDMSASPTSVILHPEKKPVLKNRLIGIAKHIPGLYDIGRALYHRRRDKK